MASCDEPGIDVGPSPSWEDTGNTIAPGFGQFGEGRPRPFPWSRAQIPVLRLWLNPCWTELLAVRSSWEFPGVKSM